jgi:hypothetical protein
VKFTALLQACAVKHNIYKHLEPQHANSSSEVNIVFKTAAVPVLGFEKLWADKQTTQKSEYRALVAKYADADSLMKHLFKVIYDTGNLAGYTSALVLDSREQTFIVKTAKENRESYCKALTRRTLFSALYCTYTVMLNQLKAVLKASTQAGQANVPKATGQQNTQEECFKEIQRHKWQNIKVTAQIIKVIKQYQSQHLWL